MTQLCRTLLDFVLVRRQIACQKALAYAPALTLFFSFLANAGQSSSGKLVIVGGGATPAGLHRKLLNLAGGTNANVLVVPFASSLTNAGEASLKAFQEAGATHAAVLDAKSKSAVANVRSAQVIWFPGGNQSKLMEVLRQIGVVEAIHECYVRGGVIGGTSAGAAVMSKVMITGNPKQAGAAPPLAAGLGLWPDAIVEQHFIKRHREPRLQAAVAAHPELLGVGIDESTYVLVDGSECEVGGKSSVLLLDQRNRHEITRTEYKAGTRFKIGNSK